MRALITTATSLALVGTLIGCGAEKLNLKGTHGPGTGGQTPVLVPLGDSGMAFNLTLPDGFAEASAGSSSHASQTNGAYIPPAPNPNVKPDPYPSRIHFECDDATPIPGSSNNVHEDIAPIRAWIGIGLEETHDDMVSYEGREFPFTCYNYATITLIDLRPDASYKVFARIYTAGGNLAYTGETYQFTLADQYVLLEMHQFSNGTMTVGVIFDDDPPAPVPLPIPVPGPGPIPGCGDDIACIEIYGPEDCELSFTDETGNTHHFIGGGDNQCFALLDLSHQLCDAGFEAAAFTRVRCSMTLD